MFQLFCALLFLVLPFQHAIAESLDTQSNPVDAGTITVASEDTDRSDWEGIPWYDFDDDFSDFYPVDIDRIQVAHDSTNLYLRLTALEWDTEETWRVGIYFDTDQDPTTGYTGDFLPLGADHFLEDFGAFEFTAATQAEWGWNQSGEALREQSNLLDAEIAVPRSAIGNPTNIDFILYANNTCCDFGMPDDIYPNEPGFVWTYELGEVEALPGDFNGDGLLDGADIDALGADIASMNNSAIYDLNNDQLTNTLDIDGWLEIKGSLYGDADLSGDVAFNDFLVLSSAFGSVAPWTGGDFDGNGTVEFADFLLLSSNFGQSAAAQAVPEPTSAAMWSVALLMLVGFRKHRCRTRS